MPWKTRWRRRCAYAEADPELPRQAVESTKRLLNIHLEGAVLASLDFANAAEEQSFQTEDFRNVVTRINAKELSVLGERRRVYAVTSPLRAAFPRTLAICECRGCANSAACRLEPHARG